MAKDARKAHRRKLGTKAWIRLAGGFSVRPCTLVDLSDTGAQIRIDTPAMVADPFELVLSRETGARRHCRIKWRCGERIGAQFLTGSG